MQKYLLELTLQGYAIKFETNVANERFVAITMSKDGFHARANVKVDDWIKTGYVEKALTTLKVHIDDKLGGSNAIRLK